MVAAAGRERGERGATPLPSDRRPPNFQQKEKERERDERESSEGGREARLARRALSDTE